MDPKRNNETGKDGAQPKRPKGNILVAFVITLAIVLLIGGIYKLEQFEEALGAIRGGVPGKMILKP